MSLTAETQNVMEKMYTAIRTEKTLAIPGVDVKRMSHYRRLVKNIFDDTLRRAYPLTVEVLSQAEWQQLVTRFLQEAAPQTPFLWKMPYEFYVFVTEKNFAEQWHYPFLEDLLFFEWIEIEMFTMPDLPLPPFRTNGDFLNETIVPNPHCRIIELEFPVHKMAAQTTEKHKGQYFVLTFRHLESGSVKFVEISPLLAFLWQQLLQNPTSGHRLFQILTNTVPEISAEALPSMVLPFFNDMLLQGAILGFETVERKKQ